MEEAENNDVVLSLSSGELMLIALILIVVILAFIAWNNRPRP